MALTIKGPNDLWSNNTAPAPITGMVDSSDVKAIIPEVLAEAIAKKLVKNIKFAPLADVDTRLVGQSGASVTYPTWSYIGDAKDVAEGAQVDLDEISVGTKSFVVKKVAKDLQLTDESVENTNGAVLNTIDSQFATSVGSKIDNDVLDAIRAGKAGASPLYPTLSDVTIDQAGLARLRVAFGEDIENTILIMNSQDYGKLLAIKDFVTAVQGQPFMAGHVGVVMGLNIAISDKLAEGEAYLIRTGALGIAYKRQIKAETQREMGNRSTRVGVDCHYVSYIRDETKLRAVAFKPKAPAGE